MEGRPATYQVLQGVYSGAPDDDLPTPVFVDILARAKRAAWAPGAPSAWPSDLHPVYSTHCHLRHEADLTRPIPIRSTHKERKGRLEKVRRL
jgi:hypothetical protein